MKSKDESLNAVSLFFFLNRGLIFLIFLNFSGSFGDVYLGFDKNTLHNYAVKFISKAPRPADQLQLSPADIRREAEILKGLNHPNVYYYFIIFFKIKINKMRASFDWSLCWNRLLRCLRSTFTTRPDRTTSSLCNSTLIFQR